MTESSQTAGAALSIRLLVKFLQKIPLVPHPGPKTRHTHTCCVYLDDVAVGVFGVSADSNTEERLSSVRTRNHLQNLHEVLLLPGTRQVPAPNLPTRTRTFYAILGEVHITSSTFFKLP